MTSKTKAERTAMNQSLDDRGVIYLVVQNSKNKEFLAISELDFDGDENEIVSKFFEGILVR